MGRYLRAAQAFSSTRRSIRPDRLPADLPKWTGDPETALNNFFYIFKKLLRHLRAAQAFSSTRRSIRPDRLTADLPKSTGDPETALNNFFYIFKKLLRHSH